MPDVVVNGTALVVQRGDTLVIGFGRKMDSQTADQTLEDLRPHFEGTGVKVLLLESVTSLAVIKGDDDIIHIRA